jgi:hypothetical protein
MCGPEQIADQGFAVRVSAFAVGDVPDAALGIDQIRSGPV